MRKRQEESEQPRFLRGFHDILITIGVVSSLWVSGASRHDRRAAANHRFWRNTRAPPEAGLARVALTLALVHVVGQGMYNVMAPDSLRGRTRPI
ncbi:hypothetical protein F2981_00580 [Sinorhizobium meliloti]|nr:hypothetical protein [Sinorhizobium meliloti]